mmetsp:Transcript_88408/g.250566  ORF Transcript_88408/g.250566 Transcript_88408/m.250566 type:complete len:505 (-) Transcript_88408:22-1536(-)
MATILAILNRRRCQARPSRRAWRGAERWTAQMDRPAASDGIILLAHGDGALVLEATVPGLRFKPRALPRVLVRPELGAALHELHPCGVASLRQVRVPGLAHEPFTVAFLHALEPGAASVERALAAVHEVREPGLPDQLVHLAQLGLPAQPVAPLVQFAAAGLGEAAVPGLAGQPGAIARDFHLADVRALPVKVSRAQDLRHARETPFRGLRRARKPAFRVERLVDRSDGVAGRVQFFLPVLHLRAPTLIPQLVPAPVHTTNDCDVVANGRNALEPGVVPQPHQLSDLDLPEPSAEETNHPLRLLRVLVLQFLPPSHGLLGGAQGLHARGGSLRVQQVLEALPAQPHPAPGRSPGYVRQRRAEVLHLLEVDVVLPHPGLLAGLLEAVPLRADLRVRLVAALARGLAGLLRPSGRLLVSRLAVRVLFGRLPRLHLGLLHRILFHLFCLLFLVPLLCLSLRRGRVDELLGRRERRQAERGEQQQRRQEPRHGACRAGRPAGSQAGAV